MLDILSVLKYFESTKSVASWGVSLKSIFYDKELKKMKIYNHELIYGKYTVYKEAI